MSNTVSVAENKLSQTASWSESTDRQTADEGQTDQATTTPNIADNHEQEHTDMQNSMQGTETAEDAKSTPSFFEIVRKYGSLSDILRMLGALAVASAMGIFLLEGVEVANDLYRFLTMLGLTGALTAAGLMMSVILKEQRGSRVFISLGLLSVPVNFTVFGALIYSVIPMDATAISYPEFAHWTASASDITLAMISGIAVLIPVVWLGYSVLARSARTWLSTALVLSSAVLIVPVRQELWAAFIGLGTIAAIWWFCAINSKDSLALKTAEGKFGIALLFVAPVIVLVRSLFLYEVSGVLVLALASGFYLYTRQLTAHRTEQNLFSNLLMLLAAIATLFVSLSAGDVMDHYMNSDLPKVLAVVCLILLSFDMKAISPNKGLASKISVFMMTISTIALVVVAMFYGTAMISTLCAIVLLVSAMYGYLTKQALIAGLSAFGAMAILVLNIESIWASVVQTGWWGIAIGGALAIVAGSMIDRAGTVVEERMLTNS